MTTKITLTVEADSAAEYYRTLQTLLIGNAKTTTINVVSPDPDSAVEKVTAGVPLKETVKAAEPAKEPAKRQTRTKPQETAKEPEQPKEVAKESKASNGANGKHDHGGFGGGPDADVDVPDLPDDVRNTQAMRDLLNWLADKGGVKDVEQMVRVCEALKASTPILTKVPDVDSRVRRAVEVLGLFAQAEPEA